MNKPKEQSKQSNINWVYMGILIGVGLIYFILCMNIWGGWTQFGLASAAFVILVFLTFRRLIMGIIRPGVKYQPSDPAVGIDMLLIIFWIFFVSGFYSLDIIPTTIKDIVALVTLFFYCVVYVGSLTRYGNKDNCFNYRSLYNLDDRNPK